MWHSRGIVGIFLSAPFTKELFTEEEEEECEAEVTVPLDKQYLLSSVPLCIKNHGGSPGWCKFGLEQLACVRGFGDLRDWGMY